MTPDRYAAASDLTPDALLRIWRAIPEDRQESIGVKVLGTYLAELVADDDGLISTEDERDNAYLQSQEDFSEVEPAVRAALPQVLWYYPETYRYEAHDRHGTLLGTVEHVGCAQYRYRPSRSRGRRGPKIDGQPIKALPPELRQIVDDGGWFGAMLPDGRRYPDDFTNITNNDCGATGLGTCPASLPGRVAFGQSTATLESLDER